MSMQLDVPAHARSVLERLDAHGYESYVVGGCVRDSLMGREPKDWDVCTNASPQEVLSVFRRFHVIKTGLQHGTVTVMSEHQPVEVTTFRLDGCYSDNRHPDSVTFVSRVEEDLSRRDFTINAMAYHPHRGLVDAFGGREDLEAGLVRCVGEPDARFQEDGLRILRALRFASRYGFALERETAYAIHRGRHLLENISAERIFAELKGILVGSGVLDMMLAFPDVFVAVIPEFAPTIGFQQHNPHHCHDVWTHTAWAVHASPPDVLLRLALLLHDVAKPTCFTQDAQGRGHFYGHPKRGAEMTREILHRLKSDNATLRTVVELVREHDNAFPTTRAGMRRLVGRLGEENVWRLIRIKQADQAAQSPYRQEEKKEALRRASLLLEEVLDGTRAFTLKDLNISGGTLISMGMKPGPALGKLLTILLEEVQEEKLENGSQALQRRARELMSSSFAGD